MDVVDTTPDLTIFAPTNAAFSTLDSLSSFTTDQLLKVLEYHGMIRSSWLILVLTAFSPVVKGTVAYSTTLKDGETIKTLNGQSVTIKISGDNVFINQAKVYIADVIVENGVLHVIDRYFALLPCLWSMLT